MLEKIIFNFSSSSELQSQLCAMRESSSLQSIQVDPKEFDLSENSEIIGSGTFATVFRGKLFGMDVAVKAFKGSETVDKVKYN